jgi:hypothetical protein
MKFVTLYSTYDTKFEVNFLRPTHKKLAAPICAYPAGSEQLPSEVRPPLRTVARFSVPAYLEHLLT